MSHPFNPDENNLGCLDCPLPKAHPTHDTAHAPAALPDPARLGVALTPDQAPTSQAAAHVAWPRAGTARWSVLVDLDLAGDRGCTDEELAHDLDLDLNTIRPRRGELAAAGWIAKATTPHGEPITRATARGNAADVWTLTPLARHRLTQEARQSA